MRWIALFLLLVNLALFWWLASSEHSNVRSLDKGRLPRVAEIQMIDEQARGRAVPGETGGSRPQVEADTVVADEPDEADESDEPDTRERLTDAGTQPPPGPSEMACFGIGWFEDEGQARAYRRDLLENYPSLTFRTLAENSEALEPFHWVIVPPLPSREDAQALYRELVDAGIEAYVVPSGENENAISLGLFRSRASAERILSERQAENIDATLVKFPRNRISYALVFEGVPESALAESGLPSARSEAELQLIEFSDCEGVATAEKNP